MRSEAGRMGAQQQDGLCTDHEMNARVLEQLCVVLKPISNDLAHCSEAITVRGGVR